METITLTPYSDTDYDPVDILDATLSFPHGERRIERVPLIGGGNYFHDAGFTHSDREATITGEITEETARVLDKWIQEDDFYIYFSDNEAIYKAFIRSMDLSGGNASISLYIESQELAYSDIIYPEPAPIIPWIDFTSDTYWSNCSEGKIPSITLSWDGAKWVGGPDWAQSACLATSPSAQETYSMLEITLTCSHPVVEVQVVGSGSWTVPTAFVSGGAITLSEPQAIYWFELEIADVVYLEEDVTMEITSIRVAA